jgi:hypothetical protein
MTGALILNADPSAALGAATKQYADGKVAKAGDTMTGLLVLSGPPTAPLGAATKAYADTKLSDAPVDGSDYGRRNGAWDKVLPLAGGTMAGTLTLFADPSGSLDAATKQYVDAVDAANVNKAGDTMTGALILNADPTLQLGAATKQYVDTHVGGGLADAPSDGSSYGRRNGAWVTILNLTGGTLTGPLILAADPTVTLGAATKQYVDNHAPLPGAVRYDVAQSLTQGVTGNPSGQQQQARQNICVAPFDSYYPFNVNGSVGVSQELGYTGFNATNGTQKYFADMWVVGMTHGAGTASIQTRATAGSGYPPDGLLACQPNNNNFATLANNDVYYWRTLVESTRFERGWWGTGAAFPIAYAFIYNVAVSGVALMRVFNGGTANRWFYREIPLTAGGWNMASGVVPGDTTGTWTASGNASVFAFDLVFAGKQATPISVAGGQLEQWSASSGNAQSTNSTNFLGSTLNFINMGCVWIGWGNEVPNFNRSMMPFRQINDEIVQCARFYQVVKGGNEGYNNAGASANWGSGFSWPVPMRANPGFTFLGMGVSNAMGAAPGLLDPDFRGGMIYNASTSTVANYYFTASFSLGTRL